ncbi:hypothetical protein TNCV_4868951 [Trichonephila clavipes]|nr:hypothetical protein TNCV_4868951 [Trichonephila clavipes]
MCLGLEIEIAFVRLREVLHPKKSVSQHSSFLINSPAEVSKEEQPSSTHSKYLPPTIYDLRNFRTIRYVYCYNDQPRAKTLGCATEVKFHDRNKEDLRTKWLQGINKIRKTPARMNCSIVLPEEFITVDDDNVCTVPLMSDKDILEFVQSSKNIIDADSDDENETNNAALVPTSSEMRNVMKNMT